MVIYVCIKCCKKFNRKSNYQRHLNRKFPCQKWQSNNIKNDEKWIKNGAPKCTKNGAPAPKMVQNVQVKKKSVTCNLICKFCKKTFSRNFTLNRHLKICKIKIVKIKRIEDKSIEELIEINKKLLEGQESLRNELKDEIKKDKKELLLNMKSLENNSGKIINNITVIAYNKQPDISHLTEIDYLKIMNKGMYSIPSLIKAIHFNPKKPENTNIYIPNIRNKYVMAWNGLEWSMINREEILDDLYESNSNILIDKMDEFIDIGDELDPKIMKKFKRFINKKENDEIKDVIKEKIKLLLYNNKNLIGK